MYGCNTMWSLVPVYTANQTNIDGIMKMIEDEVKFWIQTAKREYFFVEDRAIKYELSNE